MPRGSSENSGGAHPKVREDDARGVKPGTAARPQPHGGSIGTPPFKPTDQQRADVTAWTKAGLTAADCGVLLGVSESTITRHFQQERLVAKIETKRAIAGKLTMMALKGDKTCMIFWLRTQAKWNVRVEHTGADGGPIKTFDLSKFSADEKRTMLPLLDMLLAQTTGDVIDENGDVIGDGPVYQ